MTSALPQEASSLLTFQHGLVFGFNIDAPFIGYAVRRGDAILEANAVIPDRPDSAPDFSARRAARAQRRNIRSKRQRRSWLRAELENLGFPSGLTVYEPITLRVRGIAGEKLSPDELHAAVAHLLKHRGYSPVPWGDDTSADDVEGKVILEAVSRLRNELGELHPCQLVAKKRDAAGTSPTQTWGRKHYWPRDFIEREFWALWKAQAAHHPSCTETAGQRLLYGDSTHFTTESGKTYPVYHTAKQSRNPGALGMKWPRFDNRSPALDAFSPLDALGRRQHVVRKDKPAYLKAQLALALLNFRVRDVNTLRLVDPNVVFPDFVRQIRETWAANGQVSLRDLKKLAKPYAARFILVEGQKALTPDAREDDEVKSSGSAGRARYSSPTLDAMRQAIESGTAINPPQPILRLPNESNDKALNRNIAELTHPLLKHRAILFCNLLKRLTKTHGTPTRIILSVSGTITIGNKALAQREKEAKARLAEKKKAAAELPPSNDGKTPSNRAIRRFQLWTEAGHKCPFCLKDIARDELGQTADTTHLVSRSVTDCDDWANLTVSHTACQINLFPFSDLSNHPQWDAIVANAKTCFKSAPRKLEIFLSPAADSLLQDSMDSRHINYAARVFRQLALTQLGWLDEHGRDPTVSAGGNTPKALVQISSAYLTSKLREAWGLNMLLHSSDDLATWKAMSPENRQSVIARNRLDFRSHALDAVIVSATLPWLATRNAWATDAEGNHGWWSADEAERSKAINLVFGAGPRMAQMCRELTAAMVIQHHSPKTTHRVGYKTSVYSKKDTNVFVCRDPLTALTIRNIKDIYPESLSQYLQLAWDSYESETPKEDLDALLKDTKGCIPQQFAERLCFSHFQRWRQAEAKDFTWPANVKIPIRRIKLIGIKSDDVAVLVNHPCKGYVRRHGYREIHLHLTVEGDDVAVGFFPYGKKDQPIWNKPPRPRSKPWVILRKGMVVFIQNPMSNGAIPAGHYRVIAHSQMVVTLAHHNIPTSPEATKAFSLPANGITLSWTNLAVGLGLLSVPAERAK